jgi:hypothetical protein
VLVRYPCLGCWFCLWHLYRITPAARGRSSFCRCRSWRRHGGGDTRRKNGARASKLAGNKSAFFVWGPRQGTGSWGAYFVGPLAPQSGVLRAGPYFNFVRSHFGSSRSHSIAWPSRGPRLVQGLGDGIRGLAERHGDPFCEMGACRRSRCDRPRL